MPTPLKTSENIRKHLTKAERAARQRAEAEIGRKGRTNIRCPSWLDDESKKIFAETKRRLKGLDLLDSADAELLGIYCDAVFKYRSASRLVSRLDDEGLPMATKDDLAACQAWARLIVAYAEKLGITKTARARLAKRKAEPKPSEFDQLLDGVNEYLSGDAR